MWTASLGDWRWLRVRNVALDGDPTTELIEVAHIQRELNLGDLLGDMRIAGLRIINRKVGVYEQLLADGTAPDLWIARA